MEKIKVIHFIYGLTTGGAETLVKDYALLMDKSKFEITVLCFEKRNSPYDTLFEKKGVKVIYIDKDTLAEAQNKYKCKIQKAIIRIKRVLKHYFQVRKIVKKYSPDVIHSHLALNSYVWFAKPKKGTKIFNTIHSLPSVIWSNSFARKLDKKCARKLINRYGMRFIVLQNEMKIEVDSMFNVNNSVILNNGINISRFKESNNKIFVRKKEGIPIDAFVIGQVGRLSPEKNQRFTLEVFLHVLKKNPNAYLVLVGEGNEKEFLTEFISSNGITTKVKILENRIDIPDLMKAMDVFCFPSKYEGLGIVLIEAQVSGLKCIKSDNVPDTAVVSNLVKSLSLDLSIEDWSNALLDFKPGAPVYQGLDAWDMKNICDELGKLYIGENYQAI